MNQIEFPRRNSAEEFPSRHLFNRDDPVLAHARKIVSGVKNGGLPALREYVQKYDRTVPGDKLVYYAPDLVQALSHLDTADRALLTRVKNRIKKFAESQLSSLSDLAVEVPGGTAGHRLNPVEVAGCYAPGGKYPLPSSVLMTVVPARVAGVSNIWVSTPRPTTLTLAAAGLAGADAVLAAGGAHAIAAMAYGVGPIPSCDVVVGPGNKYVSAAKKLVAGDVRIDMIAGPSELVILADTSADPVLIAADLIAQAEHDEDAFPVLISTSKELRDRVEHELSAQLCDLPSAAIAEQALQKGGSVLTSSVEQLVKISEALAPEHIQICMQAADKIAARLSNYGALFIGSASAEVFGDYGIGPNHTLPTHRFARQTGGLSVFNFIRIQTWLRMDASELPTDIIEDSVAVARIEQLEGHARAAEKRLPKFS